MYLGGQVVIYEVEGWKETQSLAIGPAGQIVFRPGRPEIAWFSGSTFKIARHSDGVVVATLDLKIAPSFVAWHPDGTRLAVGASAEAHLWDVDRRVKTGDVPGDTSGGDVFAFTSKGDALYQHGLDRVSPIQRDQPVLPTLRAS